MLVFVFVLDFQAGTNTTKRNCVYNKTTIPINAKSLIDNIIISYQSKEVIGEKLKKL